MLVTYITIKENTTVIIALILLYRMALTRNYHFKKYETVDKAC